MSLLCPPSRHWPHPRSNSPLVIAHCPFWTRLVRPHGHCLNHALFTFVVIGLATCLVRLSPRLKQAFVKILSLLASIQQSHAQPPGPSQRGQISRQVTWNQKPVRSLHIHHISHEMLHHAKVSARGHRRSFHFVSFLPRIPNCLTCFRGHFSCHCNVRLVS